MKSYRTIFSLILFFLLIFSLPKTTSQKLRLMAVSIPSGKEGKGQVSLEMENAQLKQQLEQLLSWVVLEQETGEEVKRVQNLFQYSANPFFERRSRYLSQIIDRQLRGVPARVIMREPVSWSRHVWLNVGEKNQIVVGSPVISHKAVVGVVEEVAHSRSLVRLITDPSLHISVRCVRGGEQNRVLASSCKSLAKDLQLREEIEGTEALSRALNVFAEGIAGQEEAYFLAKGVLHGAGKPLWRCLGQTLKGEGFNYDFSDDEGPARELRTGKASGKNSVPLICVGDLLVTTGLDGVFPPDLPVATVNKIHPLSEGGCSYDLEARPVVHNLNALRDVFVLPPL